MLARLQAVSSRNMYSLHGLLALIRPLLGQVCQRLIVVSYCTPGSPQCQAHSAMRLSSSRAVVRGPSLVGSVTQCVVHFWFFSTRLHELVGDADREVGVLEEDRAVGLAVEVGFVAALLDQAVGLLLFLPLALDELEDVGVPDLERLHLGRAAGLAAGLHHRRDLVIDPHERERAGGLAAAGELFAMRAERRKVGARAAAELEEHGLAAWPGA